MSQTLTDIAHNCGIDSCIYQGDVRHRRFATRSHQFNYSLYMLALDVDEVSSGQLSTGLFGYRWFHLIRFVEKDYLKGEPLPLKQRIEKKLTQLGANWHGGKITMLVQARCFGIYFSPANFYFCYEQDQQGKHVCKYMLAEVSNTPWNERHYYLVDVKAKQDTTEKAFHVSPFMDLNMNYIWRVKPPQKESQHLLIHIENHLNGGQRNSKQFDATLALSKKEFSKRSLLKVWLGLPFMTGKIVFGIYIQALKLFIKKVPFIPYQKSKHR